MTEDQYGSDERAITHDDDVLDTARSASWIYQDYNRVLDKIVEYCDLEDNDYTTVIDIGIGTGNLAARFLTREMHVFGLDTSLEMRDICGQKYPEISVEEGDFLRIPLYLPPVDLIVSAYTFHHLTAAKKIDAILEMKRVLKPKGRIVIADLMFWNAAEERRIRQTLLETGRTEILAELEDKYPGLFEELTVAFNGEDFDFQGERLTESVWILCAAR